MLAFEILAVCLLIAVACCVGQSQNKFALRHGNATHHHQQQQQLQPQQFGAVFMLVMDWKGNRDGRKCYFNLSMDALSSKWRPHNPHPIILMDTRPWNRSDMVGIRRTWPSLDIKFINVGKVFNSVPVNLTEDQFEDAKNPISPLAYKRMCYFYTKGFTEVPLLMDYKYLMRFDDDTCILDNINFDIFQVMERKKFAYAYNAVWDDSAIYTRDIYKFTDNYAREHQIKWKNPTLHKATINSSRFPDKVPNFNTNLEVINTVTYYRDPAVMGYINAIADSNLIFHRRWGDAAVRFITAQLFWTEKQLYKLTDFELLHSNWEVFPMLEYSDSANPELSKR